jgi:hypothetical protein
MVKFEGNLEVIPSDIDFSKPLRYKPGSSRTLFILEDLNADSIEYFGSKFNVDPQFFLSQVRAVDWEHSDRISNPAMLPSVRSYARFVTLRYMEAVRLEGFYQPRRTILGDINVLRRVLIRNPHKDAQGEPRSLGLITRICSFWKREYENGNFEGMVIIQSY